MTAVLTDADLDRARRDPVVFAELVLQRPLWAHQAEVIRSQARYRVLNAGRRAGKTRVFAVLILWLMFSRPGARVLMVSAGRTSVVRSHREIAAMARGPIAGRSVEDDQVMTLTLSNGSTLESVTQSINAVRSADADLLVIDEAGFVEQLTWEAAEPVIGARPGARVLISSTPWRGPGHFFHDLWRQGMERPDAEVASWHWPTSISPLVDQVWLEGVRGRNAPDYFAREYLAEWTDEAGAYFSTSELDASVADYELMTPEGARLEASFAGARGLAVAGGIDWGMARDQNVVVLLGVLDDLGLNGDEQTRLFVPWLDGRHQWAWSDFIEELCSIAGAYDVRVYASETNGVGAYPTDDLRTRLVKKGHAGTAVAKVWTDVRRKQSGFGMVKSLLQSGRLVLPRHPELLKQLRALEFEQLPGGSMRLSVPERAGHDDIAMALMQAVSCVHPQALSQRRESPRRHQGEPVVATERGVRLPVRPLPARDVGWTFVRPKGGDKGDAW